MTTTNRHWYQNVNDILRFRLDTEKYQAKNVGAQMPLGGGLDFLSWNFVWSVTGS